MICLRPASRPSTPNVGMRTSVMAFLGLFAAVAAAAQTGGRWWPVFGTVGWPGARSAHGMVFDERRTVVVAFGGRSAENLNLADTWEWDGNSWVQRATTGPGGRHGHSMCYDAVRGVTLL